LSHKLEVGERRFLASHYTLTTENYTISWHGIYAKNKRPITSHDGAAKLVSTTVNTQRSTSAATTQWARMLLLMWRHVTPAWRHCTLNGLTGLIVDKGRRRSM